MRHGIPEKYLDMLTSMVEELNSQYTDEGGIKFLTTHDSAGRSSRKIVIEYDIQRRSR